MVPIGEGVFETLRIVDSRADALARHIERLSRSAREMGLPAPSPLEISDQVAEHLAAKQLPLGRMRLTLTQTSDGPAIAVESAAIAQPAPAVTLTVSDWHPNEHSPLTGWKTTNYVDYAVALRTAQLKGFGEALLVNSSGHLCETTTANVFYVLGGVIHTPPTSTGCLPGIARGIVLEHCEVVDVEAPLSVLTEASEVFLTSSLREVQPVSQVDGATYPTPGPVTQEVIDAWTRAMADTRDPAPRPTQDENSAVVR